MKLLQLSVICFLFILFGCSPKSPSKYEDIVRKPNFDKTDRVFKISKQEALQDLDEVAKVLKEKHSYIHTVTFNYNEAISEIKESLNDSVSVSVLALQIHKLVQHIGDSHAYVINWMKLLPKQFAPAKYGIRNERIFVYNLDASSLLEAQYPYVKSIDGVPIDEYFERASAIASGKGSSESSKFFRGRQLMQYIDFMRSELDIAQGPTVEYVLESEDGLKEKKVVLPVSTKSDFTKPFGLTKLSSILPKNLGYFRMYSQDDTALLNSIDSLMNSFKDTQALIIDARQCGGGKRSNLQALFPYFMNIDDSPYIANVAKLRIPQDVPDFDPRGKLDVGDKKLKYIKDDDTTKEELEALQQFLTGFEPKYKASETDFTDWYFMAMTAKPGKYYYDKPVYLIMDFGVGSAGDIFVSTFKSWRNITLVGSPSNGRSGNSITTKLKNSGIPVNLSTMISYQKTGELFDWVGIEPDVYVEPEISDWLEETDTVLEQVLIMANNQ